MRHNTGGTNCTLIRAPGQTIGPNDLFNTLPNKRNQPITGTALFLVPQCVIRRKITLFFPEFQRGMGAGNGTTNTDKLKGADEY